MSVISGKEHLLAGFGFGLLRDFFVFFGTLTPKINSAIGDTELDRFPLSATEADPAPCWPCDPFRSLHPARGRHLPPCQSSNMTKK